jgi:hypothetical protein
MTFMGNGSAAAQSMMHGAFACVCELDVHMMYMYVRRLAQTDSGSMYICVEVYVHMVCMYVTSLTLHDPGSIGAAEEDQIESGGVRTLKNEHREKKQPKAEQHNKDAPAQATREHVYTSNRHSGTVTAGENVSLLPNRFPK